ncbi:hypothetical protein BTO01_06725 [Vibrio jasicida]|uniref:hypothetical protein n=1 Tax=Vibrio jasicida TaxID=766224 RepID=UPI000CF4B71A|nr:hypothetical protein [Vibrio jasicida]PQJ70997.1 hypothetical protein BTO01_06725 [Vibrio jasicida]
MKYFSLFILIIIFIMSYDDVYKIISDENTISILMNKDESRIINNVNLNSESDFEIFSGSLSNTDEILKEIIESIEISREDKVKKIYGMLTDYPPESFEFQYLIDVISDLKPLSLSTEFIDLYYVTTSTKTKEKIIRLLSNSTLLTAVTSEDDLHLYTDDFARIKKFFESEMYNPYNENEVNNALILNFNNLISTEDYLQFIENELININHSISEEYLGKIKLSNAILLDDGKSLERILISSNNSIESAVYLYVSSIPYEILNDNKRKIFELYLFKAKSDVFYGVDKHKKLSWIESMAKVKGISNEQVAKEVMIETKRVLDKALVINQYPELDLDTDYLVSLKEDIRIELLNSLDKENNNTLNTALEVIDNNIYQR